MTETHKIHDPFLSKDVEISSRLVDRLRGKYACGPTLPNGEPEFGWRQHETPPIQHEAAVEIEELRRALQMQEAAELAHVNCEECDGEEVPEQCEICFPLYDDARVARRAVLATQLRIKPRKLGKS